MDLVTARRSSRNTRPSRTRDEFYPFGGGLNLVDPPLALNPGFAIGGFNYEVGIKRGYERLRGYERFDGRAKPSDATYHLLNYDQAAVDPAVGATVTGATSTHTGVILAKAIQQAITAVNQALWANDLTNAYWTKLQLSLGTNANVNPLGTQTRTLEATAVASTHTVSRDFTKAAATEQWRIRAWCAPDTTNFARLTTSASGGHFHLQSFNLLTGALGGTSVGGTNIQVVGTPVISDAGNGWRMIEVVLEIAAGTTTFTPSLRVLDASQSDNFTGAGERIQFAGIMVERITFAAPQVFVLTTTEIRGNGTGAYILGRASGVYQDNEDLDVGGVTQAVANGVALLNGSTDDALNKAYLQLAIADLRAQIQVVPGEGRILGCAIYEGVVYAFRNAVGGASAAMFRSSAAGWVQVGLGSSLNFSAGLAAGIAEGDTITGVTSGASGVVRRVIVQSGTFAGNNAVGYLVIAQGIVNGPFQNGETLQVGGTNRATAAGASIANTLLPNGRYEFRVHNFFGHTATRRLYGVDGVNRAFEYQSGATEFFGQIRTGMTSDTPRHLGIHRERLYLAFSGGSLQRSAKGEPVDWTTIVLGAAELALGEEIVAILEEIGTTLFVFGRHKTKYLAGEPPNEVLDNFSDNTGAMEWSVQRIAKGVYLDDIGFSTLATTQQFGNYLASPISELIQPLIEQIKPRVIASVVCRDRAKYRLFLDDGQFVSLGFRGNKIAGFMLCGYGKVVRTIFQGEDSGGKEMIVFGSDDGYVYQAERGTSFDGQPISAFLRTAFHFSKTPGQEKHYRRAQFDIECRGPTTLQVGVDYSFADPSLSGEPIKDLTLPGGGAFWNLFNWNQGNWGTALVAPAIVDLDSDGINISFLFSHSSAVEEAHRLDGVTISRAIRRTNRGHTYA